MRFGKFHLKINLNRNVFYIAKLTIDILYLHLLIYEQIKSTNQSIKQSKSIYVLIFIV